MSRARAREICEEAGEGGRETRGGWVGEEREICGGIELKLLTYILATNLLMKFGSNRAQMRLTKNHSKLVKKKNAWNDKIEHEIDLWITS